MYSVSEINKLRESFCAIKRELSCYICKKIIYDPRTLKCGHTYCKKCIKVCWLQLINCPRCVLFPINYKDSTKNEETAQRILVMKKLFEAFEKDTKIDISKDHFERSFEVDFQVRKRYKRGENNLTDDSNPEDEDPENRSFELDHQEREHFTKDQNDSNLENENFKEDSNRENEIFEDRSFEIDQVQDRCDKDQNNSVEDLNPEAEDSRETFFEVDDYSKDQNYSVENFDKEPDHQISDNYNKDQNDSVEDLDLEAENSRENFSEANHQVEDDYNKDQNGSVENMDLEAGPNEISFETDHQIQDNYNKDQNDSVEVIDLEVEDQIRFFETNRVEHHHNNKDQNDSIADLNLEIENNNQKDEDQVQEIGNNEEEIEDHFMDQLENEINHDPVGEKILLNKNSNVEINKQMHENYVPFYKLSKFCKSQFVNSSGIQQDSRKEQIHKDPIIPECNTSYGSEKTTEILKLSSAEQIKASRKRKFSVSDSEKTTEILDPKKLKQGIIVSKSTKEDLSLIPEMLDNRGNSETKSQNFEENLSSKDAVFSHCFVNNFNREIERLRDSETSIETVYENPLFIEKQEIDRNDEEDED